MFSVHTSREKFENAAIDVATVILDLRLRKTPAGHVIIVTSSVIFEKLPFQNVFRPYEIATDQRFQIHQV